MIRYLLIFLVSMLLCSCASSTTYYVKVGGNDESAGTSWATAWETLSKVNSTMSGGDTVWFGTGTWHGFIDVPTGATGSDRTLYACSSFVDNLAEIRGSVQITDWIQHSGNVYKGRYTGVVDEYDGYYTLCCVGQITASKDTLLKRETSLGAVDAAGEFYYNAGIDTLYVWGYDGGNPDSIEVGTYYGFDLSAGASHTTIYGFKVRYCSNTGVYIGNGREQRVDSAFIEHCSFSMIVSPSGVNSGGIYSGAAGHEPDSQNYYCEIRACRSDNIFEDGGGDHSNGFLFYSNWYTIVESCYVYDGPMHGIGFKSEAGYATIRYNYIENPMGWSGIDIICNGQYDSIYGNIIRGDSTSEYYGILLDGCEVDSQYFILNNTIYKPYGYGLQTSEPGSENLGGPAEWKYNVVFGAGWANVAFFDDDTADFTVDSNLYDDNLCWNTDWDCHNWATWTGWGLDVNSSSGVDPGFDSVSAINPRKGFARSGASDEMNLTYGGRTWTVFGAVQPPGVVSQRFVMGRGNFGGTVTRLTIRSIP